MSKEKRLGRGLEALLGRVAGETNPGGEAAIYPRPRAAVPGAEQPAGGPRLYEPPLEPPVEPVAPLDPSTAVPAAAPGPLKLDVSLIDSNPFQPRRDFDEAETRSLAESLHDHGLLQPVVVRRAADRYQLVAGERRYRAAMLAGWTEVPANIVEADDRQMAELAIVENVQRKDLNALEKAAAFQHYLEEYGCTQEELAGRLHLDRSTVSNFIRLLELPGEVQDAVRQGKISQGHARALLPLGDEREQIVFCERIQTEGLNVRQTEAIVHDTIHAAESQGLGIVGAAPPRRPTTRHVAAMEEEFRLTLGTKVKISHTANGRGKITIPFASHEEFERLRAHICGAGLPAKAG